MYAGDEDVEEVVENPADELLTEDYGSSIVSGAHLIPDERWPELTESVRGQVAGACPHLPGSLMKVVWMIQRYNEGIPLHHPDDTQHRVPFDEASRREMPNIKRGPRRGCEWHG